MKPQPVGQFEWIATAAGPALICNALEPFAAHLFSTRQWTLGSPTLSDDRRRAAWRQLAEVMGKDEKRLARLQQVHGSAVVVRRAGQSLGGEPLPQADIVVSTDPDAVVAIQTADCAPILLVDRASGAVTAAHAGWRGLAARVPSIAVRALLEQGSSRPQDVVAAIGPAISAARYEVGDEVRARFEQAGFTDDQLRRWFPTQTRAQHWLFDGWESARGQLAEAGVPAQQIHVAALCTASHPDVFCSYRRDGKMAGRMAAAIRIKS
jgi:purine-nucleoside/S-methyl-5'-thioadenosine phosphorylase / adenosine deaminase